MMMAHTDHCKNIDSFMNLYLTFANMTEYKNYMCVI